MVNDFQQSEKTIQRGKNSVFNKWCWGQLDIHMQKVKIDCYLTPHAKINSVDHRQNKITKTI